MSRLKHRLFLLVCFGLLGLITVHARRSRQAARPCLQRKFSGDSVVCVCNSTYCDDFPPLTPRRKAVAASGTYTVYRSTLDGQRFAQSQGNFSTKESLPAGKQESVTVQIGNSTRQSVIGFGGAFTDAAGVNIRSISQDAQKNLLASYFSDNGIEYSIGRIPMAGCDFSPRVYTYDDQPGDFDLKSFALTSEDTRLKIPLIQWAKRMAKNHVRFFASPWSAPGWMKTNGNASSSGKLIGQAGDKYHKTWAQYFVRFVQAYEAQNITIWGLTAQNEPIDGLVPRFPFNSLGFSPETQRDFIANDLGPTLAAAGLRRIKLMIMDDQRFLLPGWANTVLKSTSAADYVDGIGVHWYFDPVSPLSLLDRTHNSHPDKFILSTEACAGSIHLPGQKSVILGDWGRAELYAQDIIDDLNHWVGGWTDWNLALDLTGGPNWAKNYVDSPVIVNRTADEFYKQPMFYALGQFSKFLQPDSVILSAAVGKSGDSLQKRAKKAARFSPKVSAVAGQRPDKGVVVVVMNKESKPVQITIVDRRSGKGGIVDTLPPRSIQTYVWWP